MERHHDANCEDLVQVKWNSECNFLLLEKAQDMLIWESGTRVVGIYRIVVVVLFQLNTYFALKYKSELSKNFVSLIVIENQKKK